MKTTKVLTTIGTIKFNANARRVIARCKGFPKIRVYKSESSFMKKNKFEADLGPGTNDVIVGKTPEQAYRRAVDFFWLGAEAK
jgi:hypothetical protein